MTLEYLGILMWNRALAAVLRTFCWPHLPEVLRAWHIFNILKCKSSFRYSPVHILPTSSSLKVLRTPSFFLNILKCKSSSCSSPVRFLSTTFADRAPQPRQQRPYFGEHRSHFTQRNTGFCAQECFHRWIHTRPNCYTSQLLDDGWLTWWCGWHNGGNADHDNRA